MALGAVDHAWLTKIQRFDMYPQFIWTWVKRNLALLVPSLIAVPLDSWETCVCCDWYYLDQGPGTACTNEHAVFLPILHLFTGSLHFIIFIQLGTNESFWRTKFAVYSSNLCWYLPSVWWLLSAVSRPPYFLFLEILNCFLLFYDSHEQNILSLC
jgi:hypothetical protein